MIACGTMDMGDKIKALRVKHAMTQEDLAATAGVGVATVQRIERGQRPNPNTLASLAAALGVPAADLADDVSNIETFEPYVALDQIIGGRQLVALLRAGPNIDFDFCELDNLDDARAIELFQNFCSEVAAQAEPLSPVAQVAREIEAKDSLKKLADRGFVVGGGGFDVQAYEVDEDGGPGLAVIYGQWDERRTALRVGRRADEIGRAHVLRTLGQYENVTSGVIHPPSPAFGDVGRAFDALPGK
jgi:transcriptional regulator with XRE-family HTH domain